MQDRRKKRSAAPISLVLITGLFLVFASFARGRRSAANGIFPVTGQTCSPTPTVALNSPLGGELMDTGSRFNISWNASDPSAIVTGWNVYQSTNGGATFTNVASNLPASTTQYNWTVPNIASNNKVQILVQANTNCNNSPQAKSGNFTIVKPTVSFTNVVEAPLYKVGGPYNSTVYLTNTSPSSLTVELASHLPMGNATANLPTTMTLSSGQGATVPASSLVTFGTPSGPSDQIIVQGSVRLRFTGSDPKAIKATMVNDQSGTSNTSVSPFYNATMYQSASSQSQYCGMFQVDSQHNSELSLQSVSSQSVSAFVVFYYGTGSGANGSFAVPLTVAPQQTMIIPINSIASQFQGATWGSVEIDAPPQTLVAHTITTNGTGAFNSNATDPSTCTSATRILSGMRMDYDSSTDCYVMVRNVSQTATDTVTLTWTTSDGSAPPASQTVTLPPNAQSLVQWSADSYLSSGQTTTGLVALSWTGNCSDIVAAGCSQSDTTGFAIAAPMLTPDPNDNNHLVGAFYTVDQNTDGMLILQNVGSNTIQAGAILNVANILTVPLTTSMITLAPGQATDIDLQSYLDGIDSTPMTGSVEVRYTGTAGSLVAGFAGFGITNSVGVGSETNGGSNGSPTPKLTVFPNTGEVAFGDTLPVSVLTDGTVGTPGWSVSSSVGTPGSVTPQTPAGPTVFPASYAPSPTAGLGIDTATAAATGVSGTLKVIVEAVKIRKFITTQMGQGTNGRISPDGSSGRHGATSFTLQLNKKLNTTSSLSVVFAPSGGGSLPPAVPVTLSPDGLSVSGTASGSTFVGDVNIKLLDSTGAKVAKDNVSVAYYAVDPPDSVTNVSPNQFNRIGGSLNDMNQGVFGSGFEPFTSNGRFLNPTVSVGPIRFAVNVATANNITGNVLRADSTIPACVGCSGGSSPCYKVFVSNPGAKAQDVKPSAVKLYTLLGGPAPAPQTIFPAVGESIGGTTIVITGTNMDFTKSVSIGGPTVPVSITQTTVTVVTTFHVAGSNPVTLFDIDCAVPAGTPVPGAMFTYKPSRVRQFCPSTVCLSRDSSGFLYFVGPSEGITATNITTDGCFTPLVVPNRVLQIPAQLVGLSVYTIAGECPPDLTHCGNPPGSPGTFTDDVFFSLVNAGAADSSTALNGLEITNISCTKQP